MLEIINIFEIIEDYTENTSSDLKTLSKTILYLVIPSIFIALLILTISKFRALMSSLLLVASIFIPLLLNVLMIVQYSIERAKAETNARIKTLKLQFLKHISTTTAIALLLFIMILVLSMVGENIAYPLPPLLKLVCKIAYLYLVALALENVLIVVLRIYRLIKFEIGGRKRGEKTE